MARTIINYFRLIEEVKNDLEEGLFKNDDIIMIVRDKKGLVVDYYYSHEEMNAMFKEELFDDLQDTKEKFKMKIDYTRDENIGEDIKVSDLLKEMIRDNRVTAFMQLIKDVKEDNGYNQVQLANELDVSKRSIEEWESGVCEPRHKKIIETVLNAMIKTKGE